MRALLQKGEIAQNKDNIRNNVIQYSGKHCSLSGTLGCVYEARFWKTGQDRAGIQGWLLWGDIRSCVLCQTAKLTVKDFLNNYTWNVHPPAFHHSTSSSVRIFVCNRNPVQMQREIIYINADTFDNNKWHLFSSYQSVRSHAQGWNVLASS